MGAAPSLVGRTLVVEGGSAAATLHETLLVGQERREFGIAVFLTVRGGLISTVTVFREGTADLQP